MQNLSSAHSSSPHCPSQYSCSKPSSRSTQSSRSKLRKEIRQARNKLSSSDQTLAAQSLLTHIKSLSELHNARHIAIYLSSDGELDTTVIIEYLRQTGKNVCLPVLHPFSKGHLLFIQYDHHTPMVNNKFNIPEPRLDKTQVIPIAQLDIIFTPLVAFDSQGQRLGMGGGYYDRSLAKWYKTGRGAMPIGIAHDCQQVDSIPGESWDIPLPVIITPSKVWRW